MMLSGDFATGSFLLPPCYKPLPRGMGRAAGRCRNGFSGAGHLEKPSGIN